MLREGRRDLRETTKLFLVRPVRPLHVAIELGRAGGQHEEGDPPLGAGRFKHRLKLGAAIDLEGPDGKPKAAKLVAEHPFGRPTRQPRGGGQHILAAHDIPGGEMDAPEAGQHFDRGRVDLDQIPRLRGGVPPRQPLRIGPGAPAAPAGLSGPDHRRLHELAVSPQPRQRPADGRRGDRPALAPQDHAQFLLAPPRIPFAHRPNRRHKSRGHLGLPDGMRPTGPPIVFQTLQPTGRIAVPPAVERRGTDPEVAVGQLIPAVAEIVLDPA